MLTFSIMAASTLILPVAAVHVYGAGDQPMEQALTPHESIGMSELSLGDASTSPLHKDLQHGIARRKALTVAGLTALMLAGQHRFERKIRHIIEKSSKLFSDRWDPKTYRHVLDRYLSKFHKDLPVQEAFYIAACGTNNPRLSPALNDPKYFFMWPLFEAAARIASLTHPVQMYKGSRRVEDMYRAIGTGTDPGMKKRIQHLQKVMQRSRPMHPAEIDGLTDKMATTGPQSNVPQTLDNVKTLLSSMSKLALKD